MSLQSAAEKSLREWHGIRCSSVTLTHRGRGCEDNLAERPGEVKTRIVWYTLQFGHAKTERPRLRESSCRALWRSPKANCMVYAAIRSHPDRAAGEARISLQSTVEKSKRELHGIRCNSVTLRLRGRGRQNIFAKRPGEVQTRNAWYTLQFGHAETKRMKCLG